jgi:hypothetical protein
MHRLRGLLLALAIFGAAVGVGVVVNADDAHAYYFGVYCWSTSGSPYVTGQGYSDFSTATAARNCGTDMGRKRWGYTCVSSASSWNDSFQNYYITVYKKVSGVCGYNSASFTGKGYRNYA